MKTTVKESPSPEIPTKCDYCKNNEGVNERFGFMYNCKLLGYCVPFGYQKRISTDEYQYCKAMFIGKGSFVLDEVKYREFKLK